MIKKAVWIAAITRGHNAAVCLLKDGEIVFALEEERLSRQKYDGGPYAAMIKLKEYTEKLDYLVVADTKPLDYTAGRVDYSGDDVYTGLARKLGLIDRRFNPLNHPQVIDLAFMHHKLHAACAFFNSGFEEAVAVIVDGAGTSLSLNINGEELKAWETETIVNCDYPAQFTTLFKHYGTRDAVVGTIQKLPSDEFGENDAYHNAVVSDRAGIVKVYEAVTEYCGWKSLEAGKTMGLFPYGKPNDEIPELFDSTAAYPTSNRNFIVPRYPSGAAVNQELYRATSEKLDDPSGDLTKLQSRRDLAYAVQTQTQEQVMRLIRQAVEMSGKRKVVISGGYGLNCVANYYYLEKLKDEDIEIFVEPVSNDAGTAIGAALIFWHDLAEDTTIRPGYSLYLGPKYNYNDDDILSLADRHGATVTEASNCEIVDLITNHNIVALFQGRSESGPRALGNRSLLYDPTDPNGKNFVNLIKRREYFRPFAGSILEEDVHEWFDLRGMSSTPHMMYAVNCQPGVKEKIPAIIHVDGTCRIQTVNREQNPNYYDLIKTFKDKTGVPIIFNTSFNLGGEPLVETLEDALYTLRKSDIEYLYLPEYSKLITLKNAELIKSCYV